MANQTIDTLDAASALASGDKFPLAASGSDTLKRATVSQLQTYMQNNLSFGSGGGAEVLTGNRNYYVRTDGSDSNDGLANTAGGAFLTIQKALDTASKIITTSAYFININIADGDYSGEWLYAVFPITNDVRILGNATNPENVVLGNLYIAWAPAVYVEGVEIQSTFYADSKANVNCQKIRFNTVDVRNNSLLQMQSDHTIIGNGGIYINNSKMTLAGATVSGSPAFGTFVYVEHCGVFTASGTFTGSATGTRYYVGTNSVIDTNGGGATYLPGDTAGTEESGGVYV